MQGTMRTVCFATICMLASPALAAPSEADRAAEREPSQTRRPLSAEDLRAYAERESAAEKLEEFEGGRGRYIETTTVIIVLLALIVLLLIF